MWENISPVLISVGVISAALAAIANVVVSVMNNRRLKAIEKDKRMTEIQKYRYTNLYNIVKNWEAYSTKFEGETAGEIALHRLVNMPLDNISRYDIIKPLLNPIYILVLDEVADEIHHLLGKLVELETEDGEHLEDFNDVRHKYNNAGEKFRKMLRNAIYEQLKELLLQDEMKINK